MTLFWAVLLIVNQIGAWTKGPFWLKELNWFASGISLVMFSLYVTGVF